MPKIKSVAEENGPSVDAWLQDGHPNPEFFVKDGDGFEALQAALDSKNLWGDYFGKLYRIAPLRNGADKPPRLEKFASTLSLEQIQKRYGGRKFSAWMARRVGTKDVILGKFHFDIEAQPIWKDTDVAASDGTATTSSTAGSGPGINSDVIALLGKVLTDALQKKDEAEKQGKAFNPIEALNDAVGIYKSAFTGAIETLGAKAGGGFDSEQLLKWATLLMPFIAKLFESKEPKQDPILMKLLDRAMATPETNASSQFDAMLGIFEKFQAIAGGGGAHQKTSIVDVGMAFVQGLPGILQHATTLTDKFVEMRKNNPITVSANPAPQVEATPNSLPAPKPANEPPGPKLVPQNNGAAIDPQQARIVANALINRMLVRKMLEAPAAADRGEDEDSGGSEAASTADALDQPYAAFLRDIFIKAATDTATQEQLKNDPIFKEAFQKKTMPEIVEFCTDYVSFWEGAAGTSA